MSAASLLVGNRFLHDASLVMLFGGSGFIQLVAPDLKFALQQVWTRPERAAVSVTIATTILAVPLNVASFTESWPTTDFVATYLLQTHGGRVLILQIVSAATLLGVWMYPMPKNVVLVAGLMLCELALAGHASDGDNIENIVVASMEAVHILAGAAWLGALPVLLIILNCVSHNVHRGGGIAALQKFSAVGHFTVTLTFICGISTALLINGLPSPTRDYGRAVLLKTFLVFTMALLALINRYAIVPRLRSHRGASALLVAGSTAEILLGMTALLLVASFGITDPA